jgi:hypothetical protein
MTFFGLVAKNLFRQKTRTGLTVLGISIGIMTVIALGVVADGLRASTGDLLRLGESDFLVAQQGASDLTFSTVTHEEWLALERVPGVARATGVLMHVTRVGSNAFFLVFGVRPEQLAANPPRLVAGELLAPQAADEIVLGARAAEDLASARRSRSTTGRSASSASFRPVSGFRTAAATRRWQRSKRWPAAAASSPASTSRSIPTRTRRWWRRRSRSGSRSSPRSAT